MVTVVVAPDTAESMAWAALSAVTDPEIPVLSVVDLGLIRHVTCNGNGHIEVGLAPTYSGCPATAVIRGSVMAALHAAGFAHPNVVEVLVPPWTSDWLSTEGRQKLQRYGIAPPCTFCRIAACSVA
jgi:ring-1,2-phenylacetyl-CoA epoxidase subunit PaaD